MDNTTPRTYRKALRFNAKALCIAKKTVRGALTALAALQLSACFGAGELGRMRHEIESQRPEAEYRRVVEMTLGPMSLGLVKFGSLQLRKLQWSGENVLLGSFRGRNRGPWSFRTA